MGKDNVEYRFLEENNTTRLAQRTTFNCKPSDLQIKSDILTIFPEHQWHNRDLTLDGHVESQENKKALFLHDKLRTEFASACSAKTKLLIDHCLK